MENPINNFLNKNRSEQIYEVGKLQANVRSAYGVFNSIIGGIVFLLLGAIFFFLAGTHLIGIGIMVVGILIPVMTIKNRKKEMKALSGDVAAPVSAPVTLSSDETIVDYVAGVMAVGSHSITFVLGSAGEKAAPENTIVLTNKNVRFVYVPMPGGDVTTQSTDISEFNFLLAQKDVDEKLKSLLAQGGLTALVNTSAKNFSIALSDLKNVHFNMMGNVVFEDAQGKSYSYGLRTPEDTAKIKQLFANFISA